MFIGPEKQNKKTNLGVYFSDAAVKKGFYSRRENKEQ